MIVRIAEHLGDIEDTVNELDRISGDADSGGFSRQNTGVFRRFGQGPPGAL